MQKVHDTSFEIGKESEIVKVLLGNRCHSYIAQALSWL